MDHPPPARKPSVGYPSETQKGKVGWARRQCTYYHQKNIGRSWVWKLQLYTSLMEIQLKTQRVQGWASIRVYSSSKRSSLDQPKPSNKFNQVRSNENNDTHSKRSASITREVNHFRIDRIKQIVDIHTMISRQFWTIGITKDTLHR